MRNIFKIKGESISAVGNVIEIKIPQKRFNNPILNEIYEENEKLKREILRARSSYLSCKN